jgi:hypothetical protein
MKKILRVVGMIMFYGSGLFMFLFWLRAMSAWFGSFGVFLAVVLCPGLVIFPIINWLVEGVFSVTYFSIWGLGVVGGIIFALSSERQHQL